MCGVNCSVLVDIFEDCVELTEEILEGAFDLLVDCISVIIFQYLALSDEVNIFFLCELDCDVFEWLALPAGVSKNSNLVDFISVICLDSEVYFALLRVAAVFCLLRAEVWVSKLCLCFYLFLGNLFFGVSNNFFFLFILFTFFFSHFFSSYKCEK